MANTYNQILTRGLGSSLSSTPVVDGKIRFATDTQELYIDFGVARIAITDVIKGKTESQIKALNPPLNKIYLSSDTLKLLYKSGNNWITLNPDLPVAASVGPADINSNAGVVGTSAKYAREDHEHKIALATGDANGQVKIAGTNVNVKGLGSLAYLNSVSSSNITSSSDEFDMDFGELTDDD